MILNEFFNLPQVFEKDMEEGIFGSKPSPVLPIVAKIDKVARELTPQNVETGKQIIQSHTRDITRMLNPQDRAGVDVIEQDELEEVDRRGFLKGVGAAAVAGTAGGANAFDFGKKNNEKKFEDFITEPADKEKYLGLHKKAKQLYTAMAINPSLRAAAYVEIAAFKTFKKQMAEKYKISDNLDEQGVAEGSIEKTATGLKHHADFPDYPNGKGTQFKPDLDRLNKGLTGRLDKAFGVKWDPTNKRKEISADPTGVAEAKDDYVPPKEADYGKKYQAMVLRVGEKAKQQEKARQQQPKAPVRESRLALLKQIIQS